MNYNPTDPCACGHGAINTHRLDDYGNLKCSFGCKDCTEIFEEPTEEDLAGVFVPAFSGFTVTRDDLIRFAIVLVCFIGGTALYLLGIWEKTK